MTALALSNSNDVAEELVEHAVRSIESADYFAQPFPHIFFRDFFPEAIYAELIHSVPDNGFRKLNANGTRMALRLDGDNIERIEPERRALWAAVSAMLTSPRVEEAIRSKLHDGLEVRARGDRIAGARQLRMAAHPVVYRDLDGYEIKPHPDTRKKVVTMQLYCPADETQKELGTTLYRASVKGLLHPKSYGLEPVKTLPFLPNVGYAFVVLKAYHTLRGMSWHGRPKIKAPIDRPRISILNTFYADDGQGS